MVTLLITLLLGVGHQCYITLLTSLVLVTNNFLYTGIPCGRTIHARRLIPCGRRLSLSPRRCIVVKVANANKCLRSRCRFAVSRLACRRGISTGGTIVGRELHRCNIMKCSAFLLAGFEGFASSNSFNIRQCTNGIFLPEPFTGRSLGIIRRGSIVRGMSRLCANNSDSGEALVRVRRVFCVLLVNKVLLGYLEVSEAFFGRRRMLSVRGSNRRISCSM